MYTLPTKNGYKADQHHQQFAQMCSQAEEGLASAESIQVGQQTARADDLQRSNCNKAVMKRN